MARRRARGVIAAAVVAVVVALSGCASAVSGTEAADPDAIAERASVVGISPDLVYTTEVAGYDLAPQSVGPSAEDGISATWVDAATGAMLTIRTRAGALTAASCAEIPLWDGPVQPVTCTEEGDVWHRSVEDVHEYVAVRDGASIWITGMNGAPREDLHEAALAAHVPSTAELELLFSDLPEVQPTPVERGDLPGDGDGAPIDNTGPGG